MAKIFQDKDRYVTAGINNDLPLCLQLFLWKCIDELLASGLEVDYLQIFDLFVIESDSKLGKRLKVTHKQEIPEYQKEYILEYVENVAGKVFVIDDGDYATMLWSYEY